MSKIKNIVADMTNQDMWPNYKVCNYILAVLILIQSIVLTLLYKGSFLQFCKLFTCSLFLVQIPLFCIWLIRHKTLIDVGEILKETTLAVGVSFLTVMLFYVLLV